MGDRSAGTEPPLLAPLLFLLRGGEVSRSVLGVARAVAAADSPGALRAACCGARVPRWGLAWAAQGLLLPLTFVLLPALLALSPLPAAPFAALALAHVAAQLAMTDLRDLARHVLHGPRAARGAVPDAAGAGFYDGAPGQRAKRFTAAALVGYAAYFFSVHAGGRWHLLALIVAAATPLAPAYATAKFFEARLADPGMRERLWQFWWAT